MTALLVAGSTSGSGPLVRMLTEFAARLDHRPVIMHVHDAIADAVRGNTVVDVVALVDIGLRTEPERVWKHAANDAIKTAVQRAQVDAVVLYPHHDYSPVDLFTEMRMACYIAHVPVVDGRTGRLIRRDHQDRLKTLNGPRAALLRDAIAESLSPPPSSTAPDFVGSLEGARQ